MARDDLIQVEGTVTDISKGDRYTVTLTDNDVQIFAKLGCVSQIVTLGGRIKSFRPVSRFDCDGFAVIVAEQDPRA